MRYSLEEIELRLRLEFTGCLLNQIKIPYLGLKEVCSQDEGFERLTATENDNNKVNELCLTGVFEN